MFERAYARLLEKRTPSPALRVGVLQQALLQLSSALERPVAPGLRLAKAAGEPLPSELAAPLADFCRDASEAADASQGRDAGKAPSLVEGRLPAAHRLGELLDLLLAVESRGLASGNRSAARRKSGSYFTPHAVAASLVRRALDVPSLRCSSTGEAFRFVDPAVGGGAFLLEAVAAVAERLVHDGASPTEALLRAGRCAHGVDLSPLAIDVAEAALWLLTDDVEGVVARLAVGDALLRDDRPSLLAASSFDWVLGNPPWVAFQGRAAQKLSPENRARLRADYSAFRGYPTLHGVFVQRAAELAPGGVVSLLLPSSVSDLDGYGPSRAALTRTHLVLEPLLEYGQDAFSGVVQPCFGLVAVAQAVSSAGDPATGSTRPWQLAERARQAASATLVQQPAFFEKLDALPLLPHECFRELGFQSNRIVSQQLFLRADTPQEPFIEPLLEGKNVRAFHQTAPRLFLHPDAEVLAETRCRLRARADYARVDFVVRQTAAFTIAARHGDLRFRNSLIAGFGNADISADLLVGLLNSSLYRGLHISRQRDARQAAFPQVKVGHLRHLPAPPDSAQGRAWVASISRKASEEGGDAPRVAELRQQLDDAVFDLFGLDGEQRAELVHYLNERAPKALA